MKPHRVERKTTKNVGDPCSKYGYDRGGKMFNEDMKRHKERYDFLWSEFLNFMVLHKVDPRNFRKMFSRYYEEFITGGND